MRRIIILSSSVAVVALLGVTVVDAQRPGRRAMADQSAVGQRGNGQAPAFARGPGGRRSGPEARRGGPGFSLGAGLDLTDEQRDAVQAAQRSARDQSAPIADELQVAQRALHRAVYADEVNETNVNELAATVSTLQSQMAALRLQSEIAVSGILTDEQKEIVRTRAVRGQGRGPGRGPANGMGRGR